MRIVAFWGNPRPRALLTAGLLTAATALAVVIVPAGPAAADVNLRRPDVDGDGRVDLVLGAAGALAVIDSSGVRHVVPAPPTTDPINTTFGTVTVTGDFNGDSMDDVAASDPFHQSTAGTVWIFFGGPHGTLVGDGTLGTVRLQQGRDGLPGTARSGVFFGNSLAAGDLTGDGVVDLAIGAMFQPVAGHDLAGTVTVVPGSASGQAPARGQVLSQRTAGVPGTPEYNDKFGSALAIGDVTGDGRLDLAVGSAGENGDGMVQVLPGRAGGPTGRGATSASARRLAITAASDSVAEFGSSVAVGDLTGDGRAEVVAGAPSARVGRAACGAVAVLRGAGSGISPARAQVISQSTAAVAGICEDGDGWGHSLAVGDLTPGLRAELVVGAPTESVGALNGGGAYTVLPPSRSGVSGTGSFAVSQNTPHVPGVAELGDSFAASLSLIDLNRDGRLDVISSADGERVGAGRTASGSVTRLISTRTGRPSAATTAVTGNAFTPSLLRLGRSVASGPSD